jgi:hypothetical protein
MYNLTFILFFVIIDTMSAPFSTVTATGDALAATIGEIFDIPEANLDGQMTEMVSGDTSYQENFVEETPTPSGSNANANDGALDAALIDLLPF